ncbi:MAG: agmatinase family protein [Bacteroidetes bacterium]|nr:agmatinase family protein [Bacteroidota bacterium]
MSKEDKIKNFNPNDIGDINNNIFGLPFSVEEASIVLIPVPWDVTVSYSDGTSNAPESIFNASLQVDLFDLTIKDAWKIGIAMDEIPAEIVQLNNKLRVLSTEYIDFLSNGGDLSSSNEMKSIVSTINNGCVSLNNFVKDKSKFFLDKNKIVAVIGGEHSVPLGLFYALAEKYDNYGILQIDAHADLRDSYEEFTYSHASIMFNATKISQISKLVQIGIRDFCEDEYNLIQNSEDRIKTFFDKDIKQALYEGQTWKSITDKIIAELPQNVFISFDIDGLDPKLCPNTGTPVPGGLELEQIYYLFEKIAESGKKIIGFDLNEVGTSENEWDESVAARIIYKLSNITAKTQGII